MKMKKAISCALAAVMALASLPVLSAGAAESTYALGDVDMDGVITGHDSAVVSRALYKGDVTLTAEQRVLADVNQDGMIDQTDLNWIHENEVYQIGDIDGDKFVAIYDAYETLVYTSYDAVNAEMHITAPDLKNPTSGMENQVSFGDAELRMSQLQYNLMDANGDGKVTIMDSCGILAANSSEAAGATFYPTSQRFDLCDERINVEMDDAGNVKTIWVLGMDDAK